MYVVVCAHVSFVIRMTVCVLLNACERGGRDSPSCRVILGPDPDVLVQVMGTQDGRVPGQVLKVVHDDSHKQVQHLQTHTHTFTGMNVNTQNAHSQKHTHS